MKATVLTFHDFRRVNNFAKIASKIFVRNGDDSITNLFGGFFVFQVRTNVFTYRSMKKKKINICTKNFN